MTMPEPDVSFVVYGVPVPKGSKAAFPIRRKDGRMGVAVVEGKFERSADWKHRVEAVVQEQAQQGRPLIDGPISAWVSFYMPRPKSAPKSRRWPDRKPDLSKLLRAIEDPMIGVLISDDSRIVEFLRLDKQYADEFDPRPRAEVRLWRTELLNAPTIERRGA